eukprot:gene32510-42119_t
MSFRMITKAGMLLQWIIFTRGGSRSRIEREGDDDSECSWPYEDQDSFGLMMVHTKIATISEDMTVPESFQVLKDYVDSVRAIQPSPDKYPFSVIIESDDNFFLDENPEFNTFDTNEGEDLDWWTTVPSGVDVNASDFLDQLTDSLEDSSFFSMLGRHCFDYLQRRWEKSSIASCFDDPIRRYFLIYHIQTQRQIAIDDIQESRNGHIPELWSSITHVLDGNRSCGMGFLVKKFTSFWNVAIIELTCGGYTADVKINAVNDRLVVTDFISFYSSSKQKSDWRSLSIFKSGQTTGIIKGNVYSCGCVVCGGETLTYLSTRNMQRRNITTTEITISLLSGKKSLFLVETHQAVRLVAAMNVKQSDTMMANFCDVELYDDSVVESQGVSGEGTPANMSDWAVLTIGSPLLGHFTLRKKGCYYCRWCSTQPLSDSEEVALGDSRKFRTSRSK